MLLLAPGVHAYQDDPTGLSPPARGWLKDHPVVRVGAMRKPLTPMEAIDNGHLRGVGADFLDATLKPLGATWQPVWFDDPDALVAALCRGQIDVAPDVLRTPQRTGCIDFGEPYFSAAPMRIVRRGDARFGSDETLAVARIAVVKGRAEEDILRGLYPRASLVERPDIAAALEAVADSAADVYIGSALDNSPWLDSLIAEGKLQLSGKSRVPLADYGFAYAHQAAPLAGIVQARLQAMGAEKRAQVVARWAGLFERPDTAFTPIALDAREHAYLRSLPVLGIGVDTDWAPLSYVDRNGVSIGVASDYMAEVNAALGIRTRRVVADTEADARRALANGQAQLLIAVAPDSSMARELLLSRPYEVLPLVVARRQRDPDVDDIDELRGHAVGVVDRPFQIGERLESAQPSLRVESFPYTDDALHALAEGRVDAVVDTVAVLSQHIQRDYPGRLKIAGPAGITMRASIGVTRAHADLLPFIDRALSDISETRSQAIRARWLTAIYSYGAPWARIFGIGIPLLLVVLAVIAVVVRANRRLRRAIDAEKSARATAEQATRAKAQFLAVMTHEIRTPMTSALGMLDLLDHSALDDDQHEMVDIMRESSAALLRIIDDLLDYSRIEAGQMPVEAVAFDPRQLIDDVVGLLGPGAQQKNLLFHVQVDAAVAGQLLGDAARLRQVLFNLGGNAIKFTERGSVGVALTLIRAHAGTQALRLSVTDTGIGVAPERQAQIFEPFTQAEMSTNRRYGGTGLGLAIVCRIAGLMGARLSLQSTAGVGTRFDFELSLPIVPGDMPVDGRRYRIALDDERLAEGLDGYLRALGLTPADAVDADPVRIEAQTRNDQPVDTLLVVSAHGQAVSLPAFPLRMASLRRALRLLAGERDDDSQADIVARPVPHRDVAMASGRLVLVVDDQRLILQLLVRELHLLGYACDIAHDGAEALAAIERTRYGCLLTDCFMSTMDGFELIARVRAAGQSMTIVAMTASPLREIVERCLDAGANEVIGKPIQLDRLQAVLARYLPHDEHPQETALPVESAATVLGGWQRAMGTDVTAFVTPLRGQMRADSTIFDAALAAGGDIAVCGKLAHQYASIFGWAEATRLRALSLTAEADALAGRKSPAVRQLAEVLRDLAVWLELHG